MTRRQRGITLTNALIGMIVLAFVGLFAAKLSPSYLEYFAVQKALKGMETNNETKGSVNEIRYAFARRAEIDGVHSITANDIEITKEGGEVVVTATWSVKVPIIYNFNACLDFSVTTGK